MSKLSFGMLCCVLGCLTGCSGVIQPTHQLDINRSIEQPVQPLPSPPSLAKPQQLPAIDTARPPAGNMMPNKVESEQQVDPSKLRQPQLGN
jgi:hypothetical protein